MPFTKKQFVIATIISILMVLVFLMIKHFTAKPTVTISPIAVIEQSTKPIEDSLKKENSILKDSLKTLQAQLKKSNVAKITAQVHGEVTIKQRQKAKLEKDTTQAINLCDQLEDDYRQYVTQVAYEDSLQNEYSSRQSELINSQQAQIDLSQQKFDQAKDAYNNLEKDYQQAISDKNKASRKLKRAKFFNKVLGGLAVAGAVIIAL